MPNKKDGNQNTVPTGTSDRKKLELDRAAYIEKIVAKAPDGQKDLYRSVAETTSKIAGFTRE